MLPRAKAIDDKKGQEVGAFMPHFYNAWMAIHERIHQGVDLFGYQGGFIDMLCDRLARTFDISTVGSIRVKLDT